MQQQQNKYPSLISLIFLSAVYLPIGGTVGHHNCLKASVEADGSRKEG